MRGLTLLHLLDGLFDLVGHRERVVAPAVHLLFHVERDGLGHAVLGVARGAALAGDDVGRHLGVLRVAFRPVGKTREVTVGAVGGSAFPALLRLPHRFPHLVRETLEQLVQVVVGVGVNGDVLGVDGIDERL